MSAQGTTANLANGVLSRDDPAPSTSVVAEVPAAPEVQGTPDMQSVHRSVAGPVVEAQDDVQGGQMVQPFQALETAAGVGQAKPKIASTISEPGGRSTLEQRASDHTADELSGGFVTPKSGNGQRSIVQQAWMGGLDVPRWMMRLGSLLNNGAGLTTAELAPSPLPSGSPMYSTPPGGAPFRLRSPAKARPIPPVPTPPPSSSSIPAEAIQAEVQRQLHGVLTQLREQTSSSST